VKRVDVDHRGGPEVLTTVEGEVPRGAGEVLVRRRLVCAGLAFPVHTLTAMVLCAIWPFTPKAPGR
jgi:hypothetical protein